MTRVLRAAGAGLVLGGLGLAAGSVSAQEESRVVRPAPPVPSKQGRPPAVRNMILLVVLIGAAAGVGFIPSKRGHQD